jgi:aryl-alcohol dehydrogenase-like predicted oxidoreductase
MSEGNGSKQLMEQHDLEQRVLGRTGLKVTTMGLGAGGKSRAGLSNGEDQATLIVRRALELGVNLVDTAESYGTEPAVAKALREVPRELVILSTKLSYRTSERLRTDEQLHQAIDDRLGRLNTDYIDILHLHGVRAYDYGEVRSRFVPIMERAREDGKIRFLAISEQFGGDTGHIMLQQAVNDECWDVMMVGIHLLNHSACPRVIEPAKKRGIGLLAMFAVRGAMRSETVLREYLTKQVEAGKTKLNPEQVCQEIAEIVEEAGASSLPDLAYRFVRDATGMDTVLVGTGNVQHLESNVETFRRAPLPQSLHKRLMSIAGDEDTITLQ